MRCRLCLLGRSVFFLSAMYLIATCSPSFGQIGWSIPANAPLLTRWAKNVSPTNALVEYPRPQLERSTWLNLNGLWDYQVTDINAIDVPAQYGGQILVPFPIESALSGVMKAFLPTQRLWYHRTFTVPDSWTGQKILLHFGAVDFQTRVFVNGKDLGDHLGGYDAFTYNVTNAVKPGVNDLVVDVVDPTDVSWQLHGKQTLHPGGAAYTATSGIWQTVWIEPVPSNYIENLKIVTDGLKGILHINVTARIFPNPTPIHIDVSDGNRIVASADGVLGSELDAGDIENLRWYKSTSEQTNTTLDIPIPNAHLWSPDDPFLYTLTISILGDDKKPVDTVTSYAGLRTLSLGADVKGNTRLYLNGKATMLPLVLDQGFWPDGIYTAPTDDALKFDLQAEKALGVAVRKHIKIEPERWYYWADKLGVLVLQDMPTGNEGDAATDEPTSPEAETETQSEQRILIEQCWNHPSIISWNMFNEGWGQYDTVATAEWAKELDPTRLIDQTSGFPRHGVGDIVDCHGGIPPKSNNKISIDTEDGSVGLSSPGHDWPIGNLWTPQTYNPVTGGPQQPVNGKLYPLDEVSKKWFTKHVRGMFHDLWANADNTGATGDSYCQITDVETEEDGLISYDRALWKVDPDPIRIAAEGLAVTPSGVAVLPTAATKPTMWKYTDKTPPTNWFAPNFNDTSWPSGLSAFGSGYDNIGTPWTDTPGDIWLRKKFTLTRVSKKLFLRIIHDEDFTVYINGVKAASDSGYIGSYDDFEISPEAAATLKVGKNIIAVTCHQTAGGQVIDVGLMDTK